MAKSKPRREPLEGRGPTTRTTPLTDRIAGLTIAQARELKEYLKEKYGIEPAAGGAVLVTGSGRPTHSILTEIIDAVIESKRRTEVPPDPPEFDAIPGVPSKAEIEAVAAELSKPERTAFSELRALLARHLGSHAAARVWLKSAIPGLDGTPLDAVKAGGARRLLAVQKEHWGESATYA